MFYENLIPYYSPYEEQELLRQFDTLDPLDHHHYQQQRQQNSLYYFNKKKEYPPSSSISSSSSSTNPNLSKKMVDSNVDALSFCHTIYITIQQNPTNHPSCSSLTEDCQLLLLPDICCTIPASKLSSIDVIKRWNMTSSMTLSHVNLRSDSISSFRSYIDRLRHHHHHIRDT